jgi:hypothetical protein
MKIVTKNASISVSNQTRVHPKVAIGLYRAIPTPLWHGTSALGRHCAIETFAAQAHPCARSINTFCMSSMTFANAVCHRAAIPLSQILACHARR